MTDSALPAVVGDPDMPSGRSGLVGQSLAALLCVGMAIGATCAVFVAIDDIEQSSEEYLRWGQTLSWGAMASLVIAIGIGVIGWEAEHPQFRRSCRFGAITSGISLLLVSSPVPAGYLAGLLLMIAAGRFVIAALSPFGDWYWAGRTRMPIRWVCLAAMGAFLTASTAMLGMKLSGLGWAFGID